MIFSVKARVKKITEDDILLETPELPNDQASWVWRLKGFRALDVVDLEMVDKQHSLLIVFDPNLNRMRRYFIQEPFNTVLEKWQLAEGYTPPVDEEEDEEDEPEDENSSDDGNNEG